MGFQSWLIPAGWYQATDFTSLIPSFLLGKIETVVGIHLLGSLWGLKEILMMKYLVSTIDCFF